MHRRLPLVLVLLAVLPMALSGCTRPEVFRATTAEASHIWSSATWCEFSAKKGGDFDITKVLLERGNERPAVTVTFTLRKPPKTGEAATASVTFRNAKGTRAGALVTRWQGRGKPPVASEVDLITERTITTASTPVVDPYARTITTTYPTDLFDFGNGSWYWNADTYVGGRHRDNCTMHPRALKPGPADAFLR